MRYHSAPRGYALDLLRSWSSVHGFRISLRNDDHEKWTFPSFPPWNFALEDYSHYRLVKIVKFRIFNFRISKSEKYSLKQTILSFWACDSDSNGVSFVLLMSFLTFFQISPVRFNFKASSHEQCPGASGHIKFKFALEPQEIYRSEALKEPVSMKTMIFRLCWKNFKTHAKSHCPAPNRKCLFDPSKPCGRGYWNTLIPNLTLVLLYRQLFCPTSEGSDDSPRLRPCWHRREARGGGSVGKYFEPDFSSLSSTYKWKPIDSWVGSFESAWNSDPGVCRK